MELYVLMRTFVVESEEIIRVLGVYDAEHTKETTSISENKYNPQEIWVDDFDLNSIENI